ncbi:receptor-like protein EIX2 [Pistacia vera]|uniref:receptor-like protein EIX2 n=1 Tax=Pistacia vera TaxID=55513 RepID=UPI001263D557|nr:receptor-like protein EIX2 [Pistacia vera]
MEALTAVALRVKDKHFLRFKQDLNDTSKRLVSWTGDGNCCKWVGVVCDNLTGHILELHLRNPLRAGSPDAEYEAYERLKLGGKINFFPLLDFKHLIHLDLSGNDFEGAQIPSFLGSMGNLRYLNLFRSRFQGVIPHQLGNLSNLEYLDLFCNGYSEFSVENLFWESDLSLLQHLDLGGVNLSKASNYWLMVTNKLGSLVELKLSRCQLHHFPPLFIANFSSLSTLDLSYNNFDSSLILSWIFGLSHLNLLDISSNNFADPIPDGLQNLTSLTHLDLSLNSFNSSIPNWIYKFSRLEYPSFGWNNLQGTIPSVLGNLSSVNLLYLSFNNLEGRIPRSFERLCKLRSIFVQGAKLSQEISEVLDIFSGCISDGLELLELSDNKFYGHLTNKLGQFKDLSRLLLRNNSISGPIPLSLANLSSLVDLDLSCNKLKELFLKFTLPV